MEVDETDDFIKENPRSIPSDTLEKILSKFSRVQVNDHVCDEVQVNDHHPIKKMRIYEEEDSTLLDEIISRLPIHEAARTSILSWRWRHLWTRITRLNFDLDEIRKLSITMDHILGQLKWPKIISCNISFSYPPPINGYGMRYISKDWITQIYDRNPEEVTVTFKYKYSDWDTLNLSKDSLHRLDWLFA